MRKLAISLSIAFVLLFSSNASVAQSEEDINKMIYEAYLSGSTTAQKDVVAKLESLYKTDKTTERLYQLLEAQYMLLNATMASKDEGTFDDYANDAEENAQKILKSEPKHAKASALLSTIYGLKIAYSPMKGMFLGAKSSELAKKATEYNSQEPIAWLKYASSKYNTPETWGGDKKIALESFEKAVELFEKDKTKSLCHNFHYLDALAWLGIAYQKAGEKGKAIATFQKALKQEANFTWVSTVLLPNAQR